MTTLCVEGNVPPSDFLDVLDYEDAVHLANLVQQRHTEREQRIMDAVLKEGFGTLIKADNEIIKGLGALQKTMANAFK